MDSKKASCSKRSEKNDLPPQSLPSLHQIFPVARNRSNFGEKRGPKSDLGLWGAQGVTLRPREWPNTTQEQKLDRFDHSDKSPKTDPRDPIFGRQVPQFSLFSLLWPSRKFGRFGGWHSSLKIGLFWLKFYLGLSEGTTGRSHKFQLKRSSNERDREGKNRRNWHFSENP